MSPARKKRDPSEPPTKEEVKEARQKATKALGLSHTMTQTEAGALVYVTLRAWQDWEGGKRNMPPGLFELFKIKTSQSREYLSAKEIEKE